jgi:hypothetical protein
MGCGRVKSVASFYKYVKSPDGLNPRCKICCSQYQREHRKEKTIENKKDKLNDNRHLSLFNPTQKDYCMMYKMLTNMGYDVKKNIHKQFVNKHSLEYQKRTDDWENKYKLEDCDCETFLPKQNLS